MRMALDQITIFCSSYQEDDSQNNCKSCNIYLILQFSVALQFFLMLHILLSTHTAYIAKASAHNKDIAERHSLYSRSIEWPKCNYVRRDLVNGCYFPGLADRRTGSQINFGRYTCGVYIYTATIRDVTAK